MPTPKAEIDYELVYEAARLDCTYEECAALCKVSVKTIKRYAVNDPQFIEVWEKGKAMLRVDLRRTAWKHARGFGPGAVNMTMFLMKHHLGMTEKSLVEHTGTIQHEITTQRASDLLTNGFDPRCLNFDEAAEMQDLCEALDEAGSLRKLGVDKRARLLELVNKGAGDNIIEGEYTEVVPALPVPLEASPIANAIWNGTSDEPSPTQYQGLKENADDVD